MSARDLVLRGAGGGGSSGGSESGDTIRSTQIAEIVDILSEGEIGGLVNGLQSIYLDGVPIQNSDGSTNFDNVDLVLLTGAPGQQPVDGFSDVEQELSVGVKVTQATPVARTIVNADCDRVRVTVSFPSLSRSSEDGSVSGTTVEWAVDVQSNYGGFVQRYSRSLTEKASNGYKASCLVDLRGIGSPPWDVRVRRITADSNSSLVADDLYWESYTEIELLRMQYQDTAASMLRVNAKTFSSIPARGFDLVGICDFLMPANYDPYARTYTGTWDGTFKSGWTNNLAWVYYNLIVNERYGLGKFAPQVDKWSMYELGQWCDVPLPDGHGGTEPRFQFNGQIAAQGQALKVLQDIAALFRGVVLYGAGQLGAAWDAPRDPVVQYTPANVVGGLFNYADDSAANKKSVCTVWFNDQTQLGKREPVTWQDDTLVKKYGLREMSLSPIGITKPAQALRHAKWALYTQELEGQTVSFSVGSDGEVGRIGDTFQISDPAETGERLGGRVRSADVDHIVLDAPVTLLPGETYTVHVTLPDPDDMLGLIVEERPVTTAPGTAVGTLQVYPHFSQAPTAETMWILAPNTALPTMWRYSAIERVTSEDGGQESNGHGKYEFNITGIAYDPDKAAAIEQDIVVKARPVRRLTDAATMPLNLVLTEVVRQDGQTFSSQIMAQWEPTSPNLSYVVAWRLNSGAWSTLAATSTWAVDIELPELGLVEVEVRAQATSGAVSNALTGSITAVGNQHAAADLAGLQMLNQSKGIVVLWTASTDFDYSGTELREGGVNPDAGTPLATVQATQYVLGWPAAIGTVTIWGRHLRRGGPAGAWAFTQYDYTGPQALLDALNGHIGQDQLDAAFKSELQGYADADAAVAAALTAEVANRQAGDADIATRLDEISVVGDNLIGNAGFISGSGYWTDSTLFGRFDAGVPAGAPVDRVLRSVARDYWMADGHTGNHAMVPCTPGEVIDSSVWIAVPQALSYAVGMKIFSYDQNGNDRFAYPDLVGELDGTVKGWTKTTGSWTVPDGTYFFTPILWSNLTGTSEGPVWFARPIVERRSTASTAARALITSEQTARADADSGLGVRIDQVAATAAGNAAAISAETTARANADSAIGQAVQAVQANVNAVTAAVTTEAQARAEADGELSALWSVKVDANGRWAGLVARAGGNSSSIDLLADVVRIGSTNFAEDSLFVVYTQPTTVNGIVLPAGIYLKDAYFGTLNGNRIVANSIQTEQLQVGSVSKSSTGVVSNLVLYSGAAISFSASSQMTILGSPGLSTIGKTVFLTFAGWSQIFFNSTTWVSVNSEFFFYLYNSAGTLVWSSSAHLRLVDDHAFQNAQGNLTLGGVFNCGDLPADTYTVKFAQNNTAFDASHAFKTCMTSIFGNLAVSLYEMKV